VIIKIIMLIMSWTLATGTPEGKTYHYVKVQYPGSTTYKTVGSLTYATSDPSGVGDPGTGGVFVAWVHKSEMGTVVKPRLAAMLPTTTTVQLIDLTLAVGTPVTLTKVLDVAPGINRLEDNFEACFSYSRELAACWKLWHDAEGQWRYNGMVPRDFPDRFTVYLPLVVR
jgi:hypothetical protein